MQVQQLQNTSIFAQISWKGPVAIIAPEQVTKYTESNWEIIGVVPQVYFNETTAIPGYEQYGNEIPPQAGNVNVSHGVYVIVGKTDDDYKEELRKDAEAAIESQKEAEKQLKEANDKLKECQEKSEGLSERLKFIDDRREEDRQRSADSYKEKEKFRKHLQAVRNTIGSERFDAIIENMEDSSIRTIDEHDPLNY